jgi:DNA-binding transcriptional ArsR family regulator
MESERAPSSSGNDSGIELKNVTVSLSLNPIIHHVTKTELPLVLGDKFYILITRESRKKNIYSGAIVWGDKRCSLEEFRSEDELANAIMQCEDPILTSNASDIAKAIWKHIAVWKALVLERKVRKAFNPIIVPSSRLVRLVTEKQNSSVSSANESRWSGSWNNYGIEWLACVRSIVKELYERFSCVSKPSGVRSIICSILEKASAFLDSASPDSLDFNTVFNIVRYILGNNIAELLEIIVTCGLTLRFVDRDSGVVGNRPDWLLVIAPPSSFKTTVMQMLKGSPHVLFIDNVTTASFLPADPDQEPLIVEMHNKVTLFPTLSLIAEKDEREAREILAILERVYDGEYRRRTSKGLRGYEVDTVVIGALTPDVFELRLLPRMISYGSRFLVYRYSIPKTMYDVLSELLASSPMQKFMLLLNDIVQKLFTYAMENVSTGMLAGVAPTQQHVEDLHVLSELLSLLRSVFRVRVEFLRVEDEKTGEEKTVREEVIEISQTDVPVRAFMQLLNFVKANAVVRKTPKFLGYHTVDDHAMRLATILSISSSYKYMYDIVYDVLINQDIASFSSSTLARDIGLSKTTTYRYLKALYSLGVITGTEMVKLDSKYYRVLAKYLLGGGGKGG